MYMHVNACTVYWLSFLLCDHVKRISNYVCSINLNKTHARVSHRKFCWMSHVVCPVSCC